MKNPRLTKILSIGIILCAGILPYAHTLSYPFHADSVTQISANPNIRNPLKVKDLWEAYPRPGRFVPFVSFAWNYAAGGEDPSGYRAVNIALHVLNGLMLWVLVLVMFRSPRLRMDSLHEQRYAVAVCAALIFLLHPVQTQAVTYVIQRTTLLATLFGLLTMVFYLCGRLSERGAGWMFGACVAGLLAMLSKEIAFAVPVMLILMEFYLLKSGKYNPGADKSFYFTHLALIFVFLLIIPGLYKFDYEALLRTEVISRSHDLETQVLSPGGYLISQYKVLLIYMQKIFLPLRLSFDYDIPAAMAIKGKVAWGLAVFVVMILGALILHGRSVLTTIGVLGFFILLMVESTIIPLSDLLQEHRLYFPMTVFGAGMIGWFYTVQKRAAVAHLVCAIIVTSLGYAAYRRNFVYQDRVALWQDVVRQFPNKARAHAELATIYADQGDHAKALASVREALRINGEFPPAYTVLGRIYQERGNRDLALQHFHKAAVLQPWNTDLLYFEAMALRDAGEADQALEILNRLLRSKAAAAQHYYLRGTIYQQQDEGLLAVSDFNRALGMNPYMTEAYIRRSLFYAGQRKYADAMRDLKRALELDPQSVSAYNSRGVILTEMNQLALALKDFDKAIELSPRIGVLYANRGRVHELLRNNNQAQADYQQAVRLSPDNPTGHVQLGFLHLRLGDRETAQNWLDKAVQTRHQHGITRFHRALYYYDTQRFAEAYQDLMAASREGYAPATEFLPKVTPQLSAPPFEKP